MRIFVILFFSIIFFRCTKSEDKEPEPYVECMSRLGEIETQFYEAKYTLETLQDFLIGRWRWRKTDSNIGEFPPSFERDIIFRENGIMEIYQPYDSLVLRSNYQIVKYENSTNSNRPRYKLMQESTMSGFNLNFCLIYACESEFIFYKSIVDRGDDYYMRMLN